MKIEDFENLHKLQDEFEFLGLSSEFPDKNDRLKDAKNNAYVFFKVRDEDIKEFLKSTIISAESIGEKEALDYYQSRLNYIKDDYLPSELDKATEELNKEIAVFYREYKSIYRKASEYTDLSQTNTLEKKAEVLSNEIYSELKQYSKIELSVNQVINFKFETEMWIIHRHLFKKLKRGSLKGLVLNKDIKQKSPRPQKRRSLKKLLVSEKLYDRILKWLVAEELVEIKNQNYLWRGPNTDKNLKAKTSLLHFGVYLSIKNYLVNDATDVELKEALSKKFNLKYDAQNFSPLKLRVSAGSQTNKENEYQELFFNLPLPK